MSWRKGTILDNLSVIYNYNFNCEIPGDSKEEDVCPTNVATLNLFKAFNRGIPSPLRYKNPR